jgi:hypothetical protein
MNIDAMFPSKYVKASDLERAPVVLRISGIEMEKMGDGDMKPVLYFNNSTKGLVLNVTNKNVIKDLYGADTDNWTGKPIQLVASTTDFAGKVVDCVRLRQPVAKPQVVQADGAEFADLDDEVPF